VRGVSTDAAGTGVVRESVDSRTVCVPWRDLVAYSQG